MSNFVELQILQEEEKVLMHIASKLNDQLNRLKVGIVESGRGGAGCRDSPTRVQILSFSCSFR